MNLVGSAAKETEFYLVFLQESTKSSETDSMAYKILSGDPARGHMAIDQFLADIREGQRVQVILKLKITRCQFTNC